MEAIQLASFQGPSTVIVEPFIANAVWRHFSKNDADELTKSLKAEGKSPSIYTFWNKETSCGLRHGNPTRFGELFDWPSLVAQLRESRGIRGSVTWEEFLKLSGRKLDSVAMLSDLPPPRSFAGDSGGQVKCGESDEVATLQFFDEDFEVQQRVCVRSTLERHAGGFELRFLDIPRLTSIVRSAVARARKEGRKWAAVGLYLYWVEGAERARIHPGRYGSLGAHGTYASLWQAMRFAPSIERRAADVMARLDLHGRRFLAAHWRRGDWFLGPHPRKLEQAALADPRNYAAMLKKHLESQRLRHVFLMTNAPRGGDDVKALMQELGGDVVVVQAPVMKCCQRALQQLHVEMAVAAKGDFFVAFGDGLIAGMASMPSLLVLQMRLHANAWPLETNAFSFAGANLDNLGL
eukprot:TRINITY_DN76815_c0_g1_i1.p1 TRINITY_DN76815_c0_g1~~TRINITY_DN76815_c0_g1_i1.p1  ORF type:complete len:460 (+),score=62.96 TRINITY_DN76815_c0_g1_i1:161-1381(+)